ncbi:MAG TPA: ATP-binding protein, partial [Pyrinomonadaceae bacterium]|nr:ATP-binding protein [Pyrinomonadaceae bacterium]
MSDKSSIAMEFAAAIERRMGKKLEAFEAADEAVSAPQSQMLLKRAADRRARPGGGGGGSSPVERLLREVEETAALSGRFDPRELFDASINEELRQTALSRLAPECVIEPFEGKVRWLLSKNARTVTLNRLIEEGRLRSHLDERPLPETDQLGMLLRELLRHGAQVPLEGRTREEMLALACAVEATSEVKLQKPDGGVLRKLLKRANFLSDYDVLLDKEVVGRNREYDALKRFILPEDKGVSGSWQGLALTGAGGAGKSTLVAKVAREMWERRAATVVILDFDRPGIDARDFYWLETELARQVGHQYPETEEMLRTLRHDARERTAVVNSEAVWSSASDHVRAERSLRGTVSGVADALKLVGAAERPFLLVLDTFEEVTQRDLTGRITEWLSEVASRVSPAPLRVVVSGRLYEEELADLTRHSAMKTLNLCELEPAAAEKLLVNLGLSPAAANRLAHSDVLPLRPLELKLLAKLVKGDDGATIAELEEEIREGGAAARGLFAGIVYRRVLRRIENETARALAYPGLVLRYVTTELIQKVLAPVLNLPPLDDADAKLALEALASYGWLTYRGADNEVFHRKDLRRSMLKAMIAQEGENARRINQAAASFFSTAKDEREWAEGIYHRLMLVTKPQDGEAFEEAGLIKANSYIGADIVDLPAAAAALLRCVATGEVSVSEVKLLPPRLRDKAYVEKGVQLVGSREFGRALELYSQRTEVWGVPRASGENYFGEWERDLLFATASWDKLTGDSSFVLSQPPQRSAHGALHLADILFPAEVVKPGSASVSLATDALKECREAGTAAFKGVAPERIELTFQRIVMGLLLLHARRGLSREAREAAGEMGRNAGSLLKHPTPTFERRQTFLSLLGVASQSAAKDLPKLALPPAMLKLDLSWLAEVSALLGGDRKRNEQVTDFIRGIAKVVFNYVFHEGGRIRLLLGNIDEGVTSTHLQRGIQIDIEWESATPAKLLQLLRGPDPEFRDPCRFALLEAFPD